MHPAPSLVLFTVLSGAGYGLLVLLGLAAATGLADAATASWGAGGVAAGLVLVTAGLLASTAHLGHPERAWRALSQWRSSWLSREAVAAVVTYVPALGLLAAWTFGAGPIRILGLAAAAGALATVLCTAMIYASLRPIARWHSPWVPATFLGLAIAGGAPLAWLAKALAGEGSSAAPGVVALAAILAWTVKLLAWRGTDRAQAAADAGTATGLGRVRLVEPPHSMDNYLTREMGFRVARKHRVRLRWLAVLLGGLAPLLLALLALTVMRGAATPALAAAAAAATILGTLVERWLFFAEARHTVTLYYGAETA
jgi:DMSO reductase anchor subunit